MQAELLKLLAVLRSRKLLKGKADVIKARVPIIKCAPCVIKRKVLLAVSLVAWSPAFVHHVMSGYNCWSGALFEQMLHHHIAWESIRHCHGHQHRGGKWSGRSTLHPAEGALDPCCTRGCPGSCCRQ